MPIFGVLRVKNEARWIDRVVRAIQPACDKILVLDDHSTDGTSEICEREGATVFRSMFDSLDESRDRDFLLQRALELIPEHDQHFANGRPDSPYWVLAIDGDEELAAGDADLVKLAIEGSGHAFRLRIPFLWNSPNWIRVDGVYRTFEQNGRPSLFRLMNRDFRYQRTPFGRNVDGKSINFHCSSIPQEMLHHSARCAARLWHWGYMHKEDRLRKYEWYSRMDPDNRAEDGYRHMVIGDIFPADSRFMHAGPLQLEPVCVA